MSAAKFFEVLQFPRISIIFSKLISKKVFVRKSSSSFDVVIASMLMTVPRVLPEDGDGCEADKITHSALFFKTVKIFS